MTSLLGTLIGAATKLPGAHPSSAIVAEWFNGIAQETAAGVTVTPESALRIGAVYACISLVAETIGSLPSEVLEEDGRYRRPDRDHPMRMPLVKMANPEMPAGDFWEQITGWMLCRGNGLAWIDATARDGSISLWPIPWNRVRVARARESGKLAYIVQLSGAERAGALSPDTPVVLLEDEVLHYRNFGLGPVGLSPIAQAAETIGLTEAALEYGSRLFSQDARPGGYLKSKTNLDDAEFDKLKDRWQKLHQGAKRAHMVGFLEGDLDWVQVGITPEEAQFLELRKFQIVDIARYFRVQPFMIQVNEAGTVSYASTEQAGIQFVVYTLRSRLTRLERMTWLRLFGPRDPDTYHRFNVMGLLRGDQKTRYEAYAIGRDKGWLSVNDVRSLEDMGPIDGGDAYTTAVTVAPILGTNGHDAAGAAALEAAARELVSAAKALPNGQP